MSNFPTLFGSDRSPIAIHVAPRSVYAAQLDLPGARSGGRPRLVAAAAWPRRANGDSLSVLETSELIPALWRQGFTGRELIIATPPTSAVSAVLELPPRSSNAPIDQLARLELARSRGLNASAFEMALWDLPIAGRGDATRVMAVAAAHDRTESQIAPFDGLDVWTSVVEPMSVALARLISGAAARDAADDLTGAVDVGWENVTILALVQGLVVYERVLPGMGVHKLFSECQRKHGLSLDATHGALLALRAAHPVAARRVLRDVRARLADFAEHTAVEAQRSFSYTAAKYPSVTLREVRLTGDGGWLPMLGDRLIGALGVKCAPIAAADVMLAPDWIMDLAADPALAVAVGLALRHAAQRGRWPNRKLDPAPAGTPSQTANAKEAA